MKRQHQARKLLYVLAAALLAVMLILPAGCGLLSLSHNQPDGTSPYDAAVTRGEEGSRESWLASLSTPSSELRREYEEVIEDGSFTGSFFEFLKEMGQEDSGDMVQRALRSVVNIFCAFETSAGKKYMSTGAGLIYDLDTAGGDAYIVTNYHVVYSSNSTGKESVAHISDTIKLALFGENISTRSIPATYVGGTMMYDIAVLRVEDSQYLKGEDVYARPIVAADSDSICAGDPVYAIGNPDGEGSAVTGGIVSVPAEYITMTAADDKTTIDNLLVIRTDASVNHGNSGGGLFNAMGELIGIVNARDEGDGTVGIGYALPSNMSLAVVQNIIDSNRESGSRSPVVPKLGITMRLSDTHSVYDDRTGRVYIEQTIVIDEVEYRSAADALHVVDEDTLVSAVLHTTHAGEPFTHSVYLTRDHKLRALLFEARRGDTLTLTVSHYGELIDYTFTFDENSDWTRIE